MNAGRVAAAAATAARLLAAGCLATSGYIHAQLYIDGYRYIHDIGVLFLLQASVSLAVAALLIVGGPYLLRLVAVGAALGALAGFIASRTVGILGFTERGLQPAPQSLLSVLVESAIVVLLTPSLLRPALHHLRRTATPAPTPTPPSTAGSNSG